MQLPLSKLRALKKIISMHKPDHLERKPHIIICGPSGSGKTTLARSEYGIISVERDYDFSVSATTREKRVNEVNGVDYYFMNQALFRQADMIEDNAYLGNNKLYGTLASEVVRIVVAEDKRGVFDVDLNGGQSLKAFFGSRGYLVFLDTPEKVLYSRLKRRMLRTGESEETISRRLEAARKERAQIESGVVHPDLVLKYDDSITPQGAVEAILHNAFSRKLLAQK